MSVKRLCGEHNCEPYKIYIDIIVFMYKKSQFIWLKAKSISFASIVYR